MKRESAVTRWWHAYGAVPAEGEYADCWMLLIVGRATRPPGDERVRRLTPGGLPYLTSWDHEPTAAETAALHPEEQP